MIFLDANFFLRALTDSDSPDDQARKAVVRSLFRQADRGEVELTTSEAVIAEVAYVLASKNQYALSAAEASARIETLLRLRGVKLHDKRVLLNALKLWSDHPKIGFVDALAASYGQQPGIELATFDSHFDRISEVNRWVPNTNE